MDCLQGQLTRTQASTTCQSTVQGFTPPQKSTAKLTHTATAHFFSSSLFFFRGKKFTSWKTTVLRLQRRWPNSGSHRTAKLLEASKRVVVAGTKLRRGCVIVMVATMAASSIVSLLTNLHHSQKTLSSEQQSAHCSRGAANARKGTALQKSYSSLHVRSGASPFNPQYWNQCTRFNER